MDNICKDDKKVIAIFHSRNFGLQNAFTSGMCQSSGDAVVLLDGDMQDPPELIPKLISKWIEGYEVVYGERVSRDSPPVMNFFYKAFYSESSSLNVTKAEPKNYKIFLNLKI